MPVQKITPRLSAVLLAFEILKTIELESEDPGHVQDYILGQRYVKMSTKCYVIIF